MAKETAEQKLLRLIEQGDGSDSSGQPVVSKSSSVDPRQVLNAVQSVGASFAFSSVLANVGGLFKGFFIYTPGQGFGVRDLNKILVMAVGIMTIVFSISLARGIKISNQAISFNQLASAPFSSKNFLPSFFDVKDYLHTVSLRNIFHPFEQKVIEKKQEEEATVVRRISSQTKNLKLVGISWLDTPESASAMVENTENGVTHFLRTGEKINGVTVEAIYADSIVLEFSGERMELKL